MISVQDEHARFTRAILKDPYNPIHYLSRALFYAGLEYPDLACGDAYRALLLTDEVQSGEFSVQVRTALLGPDDHHIASGSLDDDNIEKALHTKLMLKAKESSHTAFLYLIQNLIKIGDHDASSEFAKRALQTWTDDEEFLQLQTQIPPSAHEGAKASSPCAERIGSPHQNKPCFVRRLLYPWNHHEPDRYCNETLTELNLMLEEMSGCCEIRAVDLPVLSHVIDVGADDKYKTPQATRQLGIFATRDITGGETVLLEPSILTACSNRHDALCDACAAPLPNMSIGDTLPHCEECDDVYFCSMMCHDRARRTYHPSICGVSEFDGMLKDPPAACASDALYLLLYARIIAMAETQELHPLDLPHIKYLWADFSPAHSSVHERHLPFTFEHNIARPIHLLTNLGLDIFQPDVVERYDTWVTNTILAKLRGVASAKMSSHARRPDVAAVHPIWCLANHSCAPNVCWSWGAEDEAFRGDEKGSIGLIARTQDQLVQWGPSARDSRAETNTASNCSRPKNGAIITEGSEILNHYCDVAMPVQERREWACGALGGNCMCERCVWESANTSTT